MDILQEVYAELNLSQTERVQMNEVVSRIFTAYRKDDSTSYIQAFQGALGKPTTGTLENRDQFKKELKILLVSYEVQSRERNYKIPFPHFSVPRTQGELDQMISKIYPFPTKFVKERMTKDPSNSYVNSAHHLESVDTSASYYDCLIHSFLTCLTPSYRKLSNNQRTAVAYYFRRMICPRYMSISDIKHKEYYETRSSLSEFSPNYADRDALSKLSTEIKDESQALLKNALNTAIQSIDEDTLARHFIKEYTFLEDRHASLLANAFNIKILLINNIGSVLTISEYTPVKATTHTIIIYNPGDGHFRAVRRTTDSKFYFENEDTGLQAFITEELGKLRTHSKARCNYVNGEIVLHKGIEKTITDVSYGEPDAEGFINCISVQLNNEKEKGPYGGQRTKDTPIAEIRKKPTAGGKRTTRKQRRIFLKT